MCLAKWPSCTSIWQRPQVARRLGVRAVEDHVRPTDVVVRAERVGKSHQDLALKIGIERLLAPDAADHVVSTQYRMHVVVVPSQLHSFRPVLLGG